MSIKVLLFASARERVGVSELELNVPAGTRVVDILGRAELKGLAPLRASLRVALNEEFSPEDAAVRDGDVLAVIPPVCGG